MHSSALSDPVLVLGCSAEADELNSVCLEATLE